MGAIRPWRVKTTDLEDKQREAVDEGRAAGSTLGAFHSAPINLALD
jgi:hypothetical protein